MFPVWVDVGLGQRIVPWLSAVLLVVGATGGMAQVGAKDPNVAPKFAETGPPLIVMLGQDTKLGPPFAEGYTEIFGWGSGLDVWSAASSVDTLAGRIDSSASARTGAELGFHDVSGTGRGFLNETLSVQRACASQAASLPAQWSVDYEGDVSLFGNYQGDFFSYGQAEGAYILRLHSGASAGENIHSRVAESSFESISGIWKAPVEPALEIGEMRDVRAGLETKARAMGPVDSSGGAGSAGAGSFALIQDLSLNWTDETPPDLTVIPALASHQEDWVQGPLEIDARAQDAESCAATLRIMIDGAISLQKDPGFDEVGGSVLLEKTGTYAARVEAANHQGNQAFWEATLQVDATPPLTNHDVACIENAHGQCADKATVSFQCVDAHAGCRVEDVTHRVDEGPWEQGPSVEVTGYGLHVVAYYGVDRVGNVEPEAHEVDVEVGCPGLLPAVPVLETCLPL